MFQRLIIRSSTLQPADLIRTARKLAEGKGGKPQQADLRRAQSTAYYAVFHCLAKNCADTLIGTKSTSRSNPAWKQVYRSLQHTQVSACCKQSAMMEKFPKKVADFGNAFVDLQIKRHDADYNPERTFYRSAVTEDIDLAEVAINDLDAVDLADRKAFAAFVLLNRRK